MATELGAEHMLQAAQFTAVFNLVDNLKNEKMPAFRAHLGGHVYERPWACQRRQNLPTSLRRLPCQWRRPLRPAPLNTTPGRLTSPWPACVVTTSFGVVPGSRAAAAAEASTPRVSVHPARYECTRANCSRSLSISSLSVSLPLSLHLFNNLSFSVTCSLMLAHAHTHTLSHPHPLFCHHRSMDGFFLKERVLSLSTHGLYGR